MTTIPFLVLLRIVILFVHRIIPRSTTITVTAQDRPEIYFNKSNVAFADAEDYVEQCGYIMSIETGANCLNLVAYEPPALNITIDVKGV
jgi:hypothetical protein